MRAMKVLALLSLVTLQSGLAAQDKLGVTGANISEVGIYRARVVEKVEVPGMTGRTNQVLDSFTLLKATTLIPARVGTRFGFRYTVQGKPAKAPIALTMIGEHPPLKNPKTGKIETRDEYNLQSWIGPTYTSYSLDEEWECVPGKWKFEIWHKGKLLCQQTFTVVEE